LIGTIRFRLAVWYALSFGLGLILLGSTLYGVVHYRLVRHHDDGLRQAAASVGRVLDRGDDSAAITASQQADIDRIGHIVLFHVVDGRSRVLTRSSHHPATVIDVDYEPPVFPLPEEPRFTSIYRAADLVRTYSEPYRSRDGREVLVRVFQRLGDVTAPLESLRFVLLLIAPLAVIASAFGGYWLASRALSPIDEVTRMARAIEANRLGQRLPSPASADEIGRLVDTFNQMIARLETSFEAMQRFTADASHELRGPLTTMQGAIDVVLAKPREPQEYREVLTGVRQDVGRLRAIAEDLLMLASADADRVKLEKSPVRLDIAAAEAVASFRPAAEQSQIALSASCPFPVVVSGDERWLRQLIVNLLDNALKFTAASPVAGRGASVNIAVSASNDSAMLVVTDSGPGIPQHAVGRVFERFYRADEARSYREVGGFGLGLSIAAWAVAAHGGTITARNLEEGGTAFLVALPLLQS
jgi:heavy metal sensor kinase